MAYFLFVNGKIEKNIYLGRIGTCHLFPFRSYLTTLSVSRLYNIILLLLIIFVSLEQ
jgi:hypothetical protein